MYERNAIVIERFFNKMFGYDQKNNLKTNFRDYMELVEKLENYKKISEEEENIMQEYDLIANKIREIQNNQEVLNKRNEKYQEERAKLFESIDENAESIQKKLTNINKNIESVNQEINENAEKYVNIIAEFNEKSSTRTTCERNKRKIEGDYNHKLNETLDNYQNIDPNYEKRAKKFIEETTENIERELKEKIEENGEKEKIPFDNNIMTKAINLSISIQKSESEILTYIYEKTNRLFIDIKNNATKCERYKKIIKDQKSKYEFLKAMQDYLIQFLDNERITSVNGKIEHQKLMKDACKSFDEDFAQISNLYLLLQKEIAKKATKKNYTTLYNVDYIKTLTKKAEEFDNEVKKIKISLTVINPNYWRIEGMQKIYDVFNQAVTQNYDRDLSEFVQEDNISEQENENNDVEFEENFTEEFQEENNDEEVQNNKKQREQEKNIDTRSEIDKKIDMILGFDENGQLEDIEEDDDEWDDIEEKEEEEELDEEDFVDDDWEDLDLNEANEEDNEDNWDDEILDEDDEEINFDIWGNTINNKNKEDNQDDWYDEDDDDDDIVSDERELDKEFDSNLKSGRRNETKKIKEMDNNKEESWENEFIKIDKKDKKKKSFFDKFKK